MLTNILYHIAPIEILTCTKHYQRDMAADTSRVLGLDEAAEDLEILYGGGSYDSIPGTPYTLLEDTEPECRPPSSLFRRNSSSTCPAKDQRAF